MIHICYSIYDKNGTYAKILGTSLCSLFENTKRYLTVHIMHDETLSQDNADKLLKLARSYGQIMLFHNVDMSEKSSSYEIMRKSSFTIAAFYRLLLPEVLSDDIKKIIYLDADIIVNLDIVDLWEESLDIGGKEAIIGAVADSGMIGVKRNKNAINNGYFNVGVLVLNLDAIRNMGCNYMLEMADKLFTIHQDWPYLDQDLLNYIFADECKFLPERYNHFSKIPYDKKYDSPLKIRMICHYIYIHLQTDTNNPFDYLFWHYFQKTPWCDASFIMNAFNM